MPFRSINRLDFVRVQGVFYLNLRNEFLNLVQMTLGMAKLKKKSLMPLYMKRRDELRVRAYKSLRE